MWHTTETRAPAGVWIQSDNGAYFSPSERVWFSHMDGVVVRFIGDSSQDGYWITDPTQLSRFAEWLVQTGMTQAEAMEAVGLAPAMVAETARLQMPTDEEIAAELEPPADYDEQVARKLKADDEAAAAKQSRVQFVVEVAGEVIE